MSPGHYTEWLLELFGILKCKAYLQDRGYYPGKAIWTCRQLAYYIVIPIAGFLFYFLCKWLRRSRLLDRFYRWWYTD